MSSYSVNAKVIDEKGNPLPEVIMIFKKFAPILQDSKTIPEETLQAILQDTNDTNKYTKPINLDDLNTLAQEKFKRPAGVERRDIAEFNKQFSPYDTKEVRALFKKIGDIDEVFPSNKPIDYVFINGSTVKGMRDRVMSFVNAFTNTNQQHPLNLTKNVQIVFLTGDRALYPEEDQKLLLDPYPYKKRPNWQVPSDLPKNEYEAARFIWEQLDIPSEIRALPIVFINAPKPKILRDGLARPHTYDTIVTWLQENPDAKPGHCLSVSNNPYIYYQQLTLTNAFLEAQLLKQGFSVEGMGRAANPNIEIALLLDNLARVLYQEVQRKRML